MSVRRAQREVDSQEFSQWIAYSTIEPFGEERADLRSAIVATVVANAFRPKGHRAFKPGDFMPKFDRARRQTDQEMMSILRAFASAQNAKVAKKQ